jgi:micrococcal nuclease
MYEYAIKEIVKVVDGDTIDIVIDLGFNLSKKERVRLAGIDSPETANMVVCLVGFIVVKQM